VKQKSFAIKLFLIFFSVATSLAILFQVAIVPQVQMERGLNLIGADNFYFHKIAAQLSERIIQEGWQVWSINPANGATGNVALLAALYALFGVDPLVVIPVNAALHAISAVLIFNIGMRIWKGKLGLYVGLFASAVFLLSPISLLWYGQMHKDGYFIAGLLFFLYSWCISNEEKVKLTQVILYCTLGLALSAFVRPQNLLMMFFGIGVVYVISLIRAWRRNFRVGNYKNLLSQVIVLSIAGLFVIFLPKASFERAPYASWEAPELVAEGSHLAKRMKPFKWRSTSWVPHFVDRGAEIIATTRYGLIYHGQLASANSVIDQEQIPNNLTDLLMYVPRALQISLFAPFPNSFAENEGAVLGRDVVNIGMIFWYLIAIGILIEIFHYKNDIVIDIVVFSLLMLVILGITIANLGTLHRIRFPYISLLILMGIGGWLSYLQRKFSIKEYLNGLRDDSRILQHSAKGGGRDVARVPLAKSGLGILVLTIFAFLGFFVRDVLMARTFGLGQELDAFVMASVVPLFLVSALSVPLGTAVVPFVGVENAVIREDLSRLVQRILLLYSLCATILAVFLYIFGIFILNSSDWAGGSTLGMVGEVEVILFWLLLIFIVSGYLTVANGVLNALSKPHVPAIAQLLVPMVVILALLFFGKDVGVIVVPIAMFVGQALNLMVLARGLAREGIILWPVHFEISIPKKFLSQYFPLVISSVFMQITVPVSTMMATSFVSGDLGAMGLGGKLVVFMTGLITAGLTSVVLPYFSSMLVNNRVIDARRELSFILLSGTVASIPLTVLLYLSCSLIVKIFFEGGAFGSDSALLVTNVMEYGVLQLPFFLVNMIMVKYAIAMKRSWWVLAAALIGMAVNIFLNILLSNLIGVAGIPLAMSMSVAVTAALMLLVFFRQREVAWLDLVFIFTNWLLFVAMVVCLHYRSGVGVLAALLAYSFMLFGEWQAVSHGRHGREVVNNE
jgi:peptidoglycan biosynthesis protein MviN/MurJ (putative lipid II flippase)